MDSSKALVTSASCSPARFLPASTARIVKAEPSRPVLMARSPCTFSTWPISCASTAASSSSFSQHFNRPRVTRISPPGAAKALMSSESSARK